MKYLRHLLLLIVLVLIMACTPQYSGKTPPTARDGVLDLRGWDVNKDGPVKLDGMWEFYWKKLFSEKDFNNSNPPEITRYLNVPDVWNNYTVDGNKFTPDGYATYRLTILADDSQNLKQALKLNSFGSAYELEVNGKTIARNGKVATSKDMGVMSFRPMTVSLFDLSSKWSLVIRISNYHDRFGGAWSFIQLGAENQTKNLEMSLVRLDWFLFGSILIMGIYHFNLFVLRRQDRSTLWFGIYCSLVSLRVLSTGGKFLYWIVPENLSWLCFKIEYLTFYLGLLVFTLFLQSLFPEEFSRRVLKLVCFIGSLAILAVIILPGRMYSETLTTFHIFFVLTCIYFIYVLILSLKNRREGSLIFLIGFMILFLCVVNDILYTQLIINTIELTPVGLLVFLFSQSIILSMRFSNAFFQVEKLSGRLLSLDKLKDEFLANTSHELRTPLNGIIGIAESLIEGVSGKLSKSAHQNLSLIVTSGKRLANLVNDILDFSKLKDKSIHLQLKPVDIKQICEVVILLSRPMIVGQEIIFKNIIPDNLPLVLGDENRIQQILFNLIGNAIKFTEEGSVILNAELKKKTVEISVTDTGIGIAKDKYKDIFTSFEQADGSIERQYGGTGLGLSITKSLVELQGGKIDVKSEPNKGSVFTFTLPVSDMKKNEGYSEAMVEPTPTSDISTVTQDTDNQQHYLESISKDNISIPDNKSSLNLTGIKALVVDDESINLQVIKNYLELVGSTVEMANSGSDALKKLETIHVDIVLLDIMMPKMNGYETARKIRQKYVKETLPIIFLTAKNQVEDLVDGFSSGGNDYITKPIVKNELISRITFHVELAKSRSALEYAKKQIDQLLEATKSISKAKTKIIATTTAMVHLLGMLEDLDVIQVDLFLPQKSDTAFTGYTLRAGIDNPLPYEVLSNKNNELKQINRVMAFDSNKTIMFPVISEKRKQAILEIQLNKQIPVFDERTLNLINGVALSLALYLENLEAAEHHRLSNLGSMAAAIVHDLKNPIGIIMGYAQMADDDDITTVNRNEYLQTIYQEANRMSEMAHEVLTFSKGEIELNITKIQAKSFYEDVVKMLQTLFVEEGISFEHELKYEGYIQFDVNRVRRVILNLATNARDAMLEHVSEEKSFRMEIKNNSKGLLLLVIDNGPGIQEHIRATLFEPFVTHGKSHGTGLGMAIVKKIITEHGGTISFETETNKGTTFTMFIPMDFKELAKHQSPKEQFDEPVKIQNILIIDDNPSDRRTYRSYLDGLNYKIEEVANGQQALELLLANSEQKIPIDAVIIEKNIPVMDGEEISKTIQKYPEFSKTKLLMLTDEGKRGDLTQAEKLGFSAYLTKPIEKRQLIECLQLVLQTEKTAPIITRFHLSDENKKKIRILIADDNILNQKLILTYLKKSGYSADVVSNGREVLKALQKVDYAIVLMDVTMPEMDGFEATRQIRKQDSTIINKDVPVIAITANTQDKDIQDCLNAGMNDCVAKPINRDILIESIEKYIL